MKELKVIGSRHEHHPSLFQDCEQEEALANPITCAALIYDSDSLKEKVPDHFNAVKIILEGSLKSDLKWEKEKITAQFHIANGRKIFWEINLGLFDQLEKAIGNDSQFRSLVLSLHHFRDTLWKEMKSESVGICIYRGRADFSNTFPWDDEQKTNFQEWLKENFEPKTLAEETGIISDFNLITPQCLMESKAGTCLLSLFCRDVAGHYLELLSKELPEDLKCFALLDASEVSDAFLLAQLTTEERYPNLTLGVKGAGFSTGKIGWEGPSLPLGVIGRNPILKNENHPMRIGICLPSLSPVELQRWKELNQPMKLLTDNKVPFRIIPEVSLTAEWQNLNDLIVVSENISRQTFRKLQGFCAAGGLVVTIGPSIGLAQESKITEWLLTIPLMH